MTATKTKEFMAEMKVLCKVHHANLVIHYFFICTDVFISTSKSIQLESFTSVWFTFFKVELIGYAASEDELFLIYEYAQKGPLKSHLHDPLNKGKITFIPINQIIFRSLYFILFFVNFANS